MPHPSHKFVQSKLLMHLKDMNKCSQHHSRTVQGEWAGAWGEAARECWWHTAFGAATPVVFAIGCLYLLREEEGRLVILVPANTGTPQWLKGNIPGSTEDHFTPECLLGERHACLLSVSYHKVLIYLIVSNFFTVFEHVLWKFCSAA